MSVEEISVESIICEAFATVVVVDQDTFKTTSNMKTEKEASWKKI